MSWGGRNEVPQMGLRAAGFIGSVLAAGSPKSRCPRAVFPLKAPGECPCFLSQLLVVPDILGLWLHSSNLSFCHHRASPCDSASKLPSYEDTSPIALRTHSTPA